MTTNHRTPFGPEVYQRTPDIGSSIAITKARTDVEFFAALKRKIREDTPKSRANVATAQLRQLAFEVRALDRTLISILELVTLSANLDDKGRAALGVRSGLLRAAADALRLAELLEREFQ